MRLLLDANLSPRGVAVPLRRKGHDVLAIAEEAAYDGLPDSQVLALAASEQRVVIRLWRARSVPLGKYLEPVLEAAVHRVLT